ncbi:RNA polymerase sigma factor [Solirubrobacter ginsenosidimutans]|uniref:RNA polymerase sigma factor n=1 Tax=Solirubrobacter ginsenosidimutans TaxID=490573 RepID=A0A9X3MMS2_9ACTN|nr:RNA polymerase sigma factor [Solirubrobacter ginsenosidimutans]MDA0159456.1 RNA polymerase sigma factor [Solirubrobacter ginsenosidimutans]
MSRTEADMTSVSSVAAMPDTRFVELYEAHAGAVLAYARRRCGTDEAEDVLAETFLIAWRRRDEVPPDALPWLYAVARNVVSNRLRSVRRRTALESRLAAEPLPADDDAPDPRLRAALSTLRPIDREALLLTAWEGLSTQRAARAAGCSAATFHVRLHRARKRLAQALEEDR